MLLFLYATKWHAHNNSSDKSEKIVFCLKRRLWSPYLKERADRLGIGLLEYQEAVFSRAVPYLCLIWKRLVLRAGSYMKSRMHRQSQGDAQLKRVTTELRPANRRPVIAVECSVGVAAFDPSKRGDFFWMRNSKFSMQDILLYLVREDAPLSPESREALDRKGIKVCALPKRAAEMMGVPLWRPGTTCRRLRKKLIAAVIKEYLLSIIRMTRTPLCYLREMLFAAYMYAYWYDFFSSNNVKIQIPPNIYAKMHVIQSMALE